MEWNAIGKHSNVMDASLPLLKNTAQCILRYLNTQFMNLTPEKKYWEKIKMCLKEEWRKMPFMSRNVIIVDYGNNKNWRSPNDIPG